MSNGPTQLLRITLQNWYAIYLMFIIVFFTVTVVIIMEALQETTMTQQTTLVSEYFQSVFSMSTNII